MYRFVLALLLTYSLNASEPWTPTQKYLETGYIVLSILDMGQTLSLSKDNRYERNPLLGRRPSRDYIISYFVLSIATHLVISDLLPSKYRSYYQYSTVAFQAFIVNNNYHIGVKIRF